jgi:hypothetical protein
MTGEYSIVVMLLLLPLLEDSFECARGAVELDPENRGEAEAPNYPHHFREDVHFAHQHGDTQCVPEREDGIFD